jgi:hypothetical protein
MESKLRIIIVVVALFIPWKKLGAADTTPDGTIFELAQRRFAYESLTADQKLAFDPLFHNAETGDKTDLTPKENDNEKLSALENPANGAQWGQERTIDAAWVRWLCTDAKATGKVASSGILIVGARIHGELDLAWQKIPFSLRALKCYFENDLILESSSISSLQLEGSHIRALRARGLTVAQDVLLNHMFEASYCVSFPNATIDGDLDCSESRFHRTPSSGDAINLNNAKTGSIYLMKSTCDGTVNLNNAIVSGIVNCDHGSFNGNFTDGLYGALDLGNARTGSLFFTDVDAIGGVSLFNAQISGILDFARGHFSYRYGNALDLENAKTGAIYIGSDDLLSPFANNTGEHPFKAEGTVNLRNAQIGTLRCDLGKFINPDGIALNLENAKTGPIYMRYGFEAQGEVRLLLVTIAGDLNCAGGKFAIGRDSDGWERYAINAVEGKVAGSVDLKDAIIQGCVNLRAAKIEASLICSGTNVANPNGTSWKATRTPIALDCRDANIDRSVYLDDRFEAIGTLTFEGAEIKHGFVLQNVGPAQKAVLDLRSAKIGVLLNREASWPKEGDLHIHGLQLEELDGDAPFDADTEKRWLKLQPREKFYSQPYEQMAEVFRKMGLSDEARNILIEKNFRAAPFAVATDFTSTVNNLQEIGMFYPWDLRRFEYSVKVLWNIIATILAVSCGIVYRLRLSALGRSYSQYHYSYYWTKPL